MDCNCPGLTALVTIVANACGIDLKQIQKLAFQRYQLTPTFDVTDEITDLAIWQGLMTASDSTKIVVTPFVGGDPVIEAGEAIRTGGGDNSTLNGVEEVEGVNPSNFSALFKSLSPATEKQMKALLCEKNLTVYLLTQEKKIVATKVNTGIYRGINCQNVFLSDRNNAGFGTKDSFNFSFSLSPGWSEDIEIITPEFNPLTDL